MIEDLFKNIEEPKDQIKRNTLLRDVEQNAETLAQKIVDKIKNNSIQELEAQINLKLESFGTNLLKEIRSESEK